MNYSVIIKATFYLLIFLGSKMRAQTTIVKDKCKYWCPNREFDFSAVYSDSNGQTITQETITLKATGKIWDIDTKQTLVTFQTNLTALDSVKFATQSLNGINRVWQKKYQEGVIEDSTKIWMHPIRQNQYILTEIAPFPEVKFPLQRGKTWKSTLYIYEALGYFKGTVNSKYTIEGIEARKYLCGTFKCWKIVAKGIHDALGESSLILYFNEDLGFTEMVYDFYNERKIKFTLTNFRI